MNKVTKLIFFLLSIFILPQTLFGQTISIPGQISELEEQISVIVEPSLPAPFEEITIKVEAYGTDLTRAFITWRVNNKVIKSGRGEQSLEMNSGPVGNTQAVSVTIQPAGGPPIVKNFTFRPQEVDVVWESRSYTPPFYKGKALQGFMGNVVVVAMPNFVSGGRQIQVKNATYKWQRNGELMNNNSGFNKKSIFFQGGILLKPEEIQVEVTDDNLNKSKQSILIEPEQPFTALYENNPLYGILFNRSSVSTTLKNKEITFAAIPYFFETSSKKSGGLKYTWRINGQESFLFNRDGATLRYGGEDSGVSLVDLVVQNNQNFLQESQTRANIKLESKTEEIEF